MQISDLIALAAFAVAILSAIYARRAAIHAHRANEITVKNALHPYRLAVFTALVDFLHFCSTYRTLQSVGKVKGTNDLIARLDRFKGEVAQRGPLDMAEVEKVIEETNAKTWQLQRSLDRLGEPSDRRKDDEYFAEEDRMHELLDWFASKEKEAPTIFERYLKITQQPDRTRLR
ncbi:hypothetical protein [Desulfococcus multivorans]|uniref:Uncharacterized protein n=1 Tax=Desulfococcus multivorans DSM 2059 TaxID=1121405 RepID=S7T7M5_DESML|nr:hypothetical protein [Desulfococcus multivorans]AOY60489.1 uncharacterized protein Dmul_37210 [Desulfococcus multivorans]AQV02587.1 hypothetical protein B2D07_18610 [Desulfococcus multivorans]EPR32510.1 hypothetical protein dsmv_0883 [Desulfococcus multivorans DSM 2059]SKA27675.1 hypothetical protein SAMN02745446_03716 [Desulfococcus multivorans DSM 2059]